MIVPNIIAIDGPAASGKSTIGERLAQEMNFLYFDTGVMYRAVTLAALESCLPINQEDELTLLAKKVRIDVLPPSQKDGRAYDVVMDDKDVTWGIRKPEVEANVSQVSTYAGVRDAMTLQQRRIANRGKVVMVGRDIGTVVCPQAELKIFLVASPAERARRRFTEAQQRGGSSSYEEILEAILKRDEIDSNRKVAPLKPAGDAVLVNTDDLSIEQVVARIKGLLE